jgi:enoyl-CoA hydratase
LPSVINEVIKDMTEDVLLTERTDQVLVITLNRPRVMNAIDSSVSVGLAEALTELENDESLRAGVLTGAGRGFSAGMDLKSFHESGLPLGWEDLIRRGCTKPLVAALEGFALAGGLELALMCDLFVAARGTKLGIPETSVGLFAAGGGINRLVARLPLSVALEMALTARPILAEDAAQHGLVNKLTEPGETLSEAVKLAGLIASNAPLAVVASKRLMRSCQGQTEEAYWRLQGPPMRAVLASRDAREGAASFLEKRQAEWTGQ